MNKTFNDPTNAKKIENWMNSSSKDNLVLNYKGDGTPIGRGVKRGTTQVEDYSNAKIILQKDTSASNFILTGYPTK
ncbi:hypothetical protein MXL46_11865 [Heyndrickxia sporothermodurans]|uniref:RNase A-like domain-containing protein n=1 Tax=Bacillaceae TaxID=186817 RepID=UPI000551BA18|nr:MULTISPECIES: RNase A-like domain-containing protein [Bacillaceae]MCM3054853.1 hypothetical protein [Caldibacillus thermoamylovorans]MEB6549783.1 hypothetical protein [Heyndrickxia sporothermodurans]MED3650407.1 hypothetical protein [Heyndrickxia sporothermodurans]MED3698605.1 hypothetical protein [Heyndrickxia sporothermodurans]